MKALLEGAEFGGQAINEKEAKSLISQAQSLITQASSLAASLWPFDLSMARAGRFLHRAARV